MHTMQCDEGYIYFVTTINTVDSINCRIKEMAQSCSKIWVRNLHGDCERFMRCASEDLNKEMKTIDEFVKGRCRFNACGNILHGHRWVFCIFIRPLITCSVVATSIHIRSYVRRKSRFDSVIRRAQLYYFREKPGAKRKLENTQGTD